MTRAAWFVGAILVLAATCLLLRGAWVLADPQGRPWQIICAAGTCLAIGLALHGYGLLYGRFYRRS